jgi:arginine/lysine/ornithine decarboxylase
MARTAALYGAKRTWYLVNGSTCGLLAGIRALAPSGSTVIVARNCHKSVFHAVELGSLKTHWLLPEPVDSFGIWGSVTPASVEAALKECPAARCVILTSPTYEGVVSDIAAISALCHAHGVPLLVELGVLMDAFVAVFLMSIATYRISREFDHIDVDQLDKLKG